MAWNEITLKQVRNNLQAVCFNIRFSYWAGDITDIENMIIMFDVIRKSLEKSNILIFNAAYYHSSIQRFNVFEKKLNRNFDVSFKINVSFARNFFDSQKSLSKFQIIINLTIVTVHIRQSDTSAYETNKRTFVTWLKHVHFEN